MLAQNPALNLSSNSNMDILTTLNAVSYEWDFENDQILWGANPNSAFNIEGCDISNGQNFIDILTPESRGLFFRLRNTTTSGLNVASVPFTHIYCVTQKHHHLSQRVWLETIGRVYRNEHGQPAKAKGIMRLLYTNSSGASQANEIQAHCVAPLGRQMFFELLANSIEDAKQTQKPACIIWATINNINDINSQYGFDIADEVIESTILKLRGIMRKRDYIARISGAKLALVLHNCDEKSARIASARFTNLLKKNAYETSNHIIHCVLCCGAVIVPESAETVQDVIERAKESLDQSKLPANSGFYCYNASSERVLKIKQHKEMTDVLLAALNDRRVELAFQPIQKAKTGEIWFYEALVRLRELDQNILDASAFVPAAEQLGLMSVIDHRVLELAIEALIAHPDLTLSVNITPGTLHSTEWISTLRAAHAYDGLLLQRLIIELTESAVIDNIEWCRTFIGDVKKLGCKTAIDDFGAGYSSFRYLRAFDVDIVKIDGAYIMDLTNSEDDQAFVKTMITLAKSLDMLTIAEWVLNKADKVLLEQWGIDGLQGEFISMPVSNITKALQNSNEPEALQEPFIRAFGL